MLPLIDIEGLAKLIGEFDVSRESIYVHIELAVIFISSFEIFYSDYIKEENLQCLILNIF